MAVTALTLFGSPQGSIGGPGLPRQVLNRAANVLRWDSTGRSGLSALHALR